MPLDEVSELYADMLEYRQQMYENIPYAHCFYQIKIDMLWKLPLKWRRHAMGISEDWRSRCRYVIT